MDAVGDGGGWVVFYTVSPANTIAFVKFNHFAYSFNAVCINCVSLFYLLSMCCYSAAAAAAAVKLCFIFIFFLFSLLYSC